MSGILLGSSTTDISVRTMWPGVEAWFRQVYERLPSAETRATSGKASPSSMKPSLPGLGRVASLPGSYDQDGLPTSLSNVSCQRSGEWYE